MTIRHSLRWGVVAVFLGVGLLLLFLPDPTLAQTTATTPTSATDTIQTGLVSAGSGAYSSDLTVTVFIGNLIRALLTATGIIFLVLTVYAGVLYMTAAGVDDKVKTAKKILTSAIIGLIIIVGAYALTYYVIDALGTATTTTTEASAS